MPFLNMVKYLCSQVPEKEWSGMLFYNVEGSIKDVSTMIITPTMIFLRDIGTKASTAFDYDEECMEFVEKNNLHMSRHGMIHSHNTMPVFFSGTDIEELQDNVGNHNIYLSLVVNNYMAMTAKATFLAKPTPIFKCPDEDGNEYEIEMDSAEPVMFVYDCDVQLPKEHIVVSNDFKETLRNVATKAFEKNKRAEEAAKQKSQQQVKGVASGATGYNSWGKSEGYGDLGLVNFNLGLDLGFDNSNHLAVIGDVEPEDVGEFEDFFAYCFNGGAHTPLDVLTIIEQTDEAKCGETIVDSIVTNYAVYYENFYQTNEAGLIEDDFRDCIEEFIELCEYWEKDSPWLSLLATGLRLIINKFEELNLNQHDTEV